MLIVCFPLVTGGDKFTELWTLFARQSSTSQQNTFIGQSTNESSSIVIHARR